jgi:hypothetical protein
MKRNPFKNKKIIFLNNIWVDGSSYKFPTYLENEFGIDPVRIKIEGDYDLGVCKGDFYPSYKEFMNKGIPYLLIEHDVMSLRFGLNEKLFNHDKEKIENAAAVIFTSQGHANYYEKMKRKYKWHIPEYIVIPNKPLKKDIGFIPREKLEGLNLVYAGGLMPPLLDRRMGNIYHYRVYYYIFKKFIKAGWKVHIYTCKTANVSRFYTYKNIGCIMHGWISGGKIYQEMSQYTAGLQAYNRTNTPKGAFEYSQLCRPNKLYDYLAAGIPTIGYDGGNGMEIYKDKWGIVIDDLEPETLKAIPGRLEKIRITKKMRNENVLEKERDKFEYIIKVALKEAGNKDRKRYYINENPFKVKDTAKYPGKIRVFNKGAITIYRGGYLFLPGETSGELTINMRTFKEIKAHVSLRIEHIE